jgi:hypothetical protein
MKDFINPFTFYETAVIIIKNLKNFIFYRTKMSDINKSGVLKQTGLRLDRRARAYYVLNIEPELLMMGQDTLELEKSRVFESLAKKKELFETHNLTELIEAKTDRIKTSEYYAYLIQIKYRPMATVSNHVYVLSWLTCLTFIAYWIYLGFLNYNEIQTGLGDLLNKK